MRDPTNSYANHGVVLRIIWPRKFEYDAKIHLHFVRDTKKNIYKILKLISSGWDAHNLFFHTAYACVKLDRQLDMYETEKKHTLECFGKISYLQYFGTEFPWAITV